MSQPRNSGDPLDHFESLMCTTLKYECREDKIRALTDLARLEKRRHSNKIVQRIYDNMRNPHHSSQFRLHLIYLIESIVKNVREPYNLYFAGNIAEIMKIAYQQATSDKQQNSIKKVAKLWQDRRNFGEEINNEIQQTLASLPSYTTPPSNLNSSVPGQAPYLNGFSSVPPLPQHGQQQWNPHSHPPPSNTSAYNNISTKGK